MKRRFLGVFVALFLGCILGGVALAYDQEQELFPDALDYLTAGGISGDLKMLGYDLYTDADSDSRWEHGTDDQVDLYLSSTLEASFTGSGLALTDDLTLSGGGQILTTTNGNISLNPNGNGSVTMSMVGGGTSSFRIYTTDSGSTGTPISFINSTTTPADSDIVWTIVGYGKDHLANDTIYGTFYLSSDDVTDTTEDGRFVFTYPVDAVNESVLIGSSDLTGSGVFTPAVWGYTGTLALNTTAVSNADVDVTPGGTGDLHLNGDGDSTFVYSSADAGAIGPYMSFYHNSASPAASDEIGVLSFVGRDSVPSDETYVLVTAVIDSPTSTSEKAHLAVSTPFAGVLSNQYLGTTPNGSQGITLYTDDPGAQGSVLEAWQNSASPAANDVLFSVLAYGESSTSATNLMGRLDGIVTDPTNGSEDFLWQASVEVGGTATTVAKIGSDGTLNGVFASKIYGLTADLVLYSQVNGSVGMSPSGTGDVIAYADADSDLRISSAVAAAATYGSLQLYHSRTASATLLDNDGTGIINFVARSEALADYNAGSIEMVVRDATDASFDSYLNLTTQLGGAAKTWKLGSITTVGATEVTALVGENGEYQYNADGDWCWGAIGGTNPQEVCLDMEVAAGIVRWKTGSAALTTIQSLINTQMYDQYSAYWGASNDFRIAYEVTTNSPDTIYFGTSTDSNAIVIGESGDILTNWAVCGGAGCANPTLIIQSADQTAITDKLELFHDQTDGRIRVDDRLCIIGTAGTQEDLCIDTSTGSSNAVTLNSSTGVTTVYMAFSLVAPDGTAVAFGTYSDAALSYNVTYDDALYFGVGSDTATVSLTQKGDIGTVDWQLDTACTLWQGGAACTDPTLVFQSSDQTTVTDKGAIWADQSGHLNIATETGDIYLKPKGADVIIGSGTADTDYTIGFNGETNDLTGTWLEDEAVLYWSADTSTYGGAYINGDTLVAVDEDVWTNVAGCTAMGLKQFTHNACALTAAATYSAGTYLVVANASLLGGNSDDIHFRIYNTTQAATTNCEGANNMDAAANQSGVSCSAIVTVAASDALQPQVINYTDGDDVTVHTLTWTITRL